MAELGTTTVPRDFGRHWTPVHLDFIVSNLDEMVERLCGLGASLDREIQIRDKPSVPEPPRHAQSAAICRRPRTRWFSSATSCSRRGAAKGRRNHRWRTRKGGDPSE